MDQPVQPVLSADIPSADIPSVDTPSADIPSADIPSADIPSAGIPNAANWDLPGTGTSPGTSLGTSRFLRI